MVNGERLARIYSNSFHIDELPADTSSVVVTLNTNTHDVYAIDGESISQQAQVFNTN
jgi:phenylpyruvate tautomerase PptA (4-oxalocrotonate tautomerase family)